jgi:hypothetical protein
LPGETITISYTTKGYSVKVAKSKSKKADAKTKYYSNLNLLLDDTNLSVKTVAKGSSKELMNLSTTKKKKKNKAESSKYYDSVRPYDEHVLFRSELPGYQNAYFEFVNLKTKKTKVVGFMVSPSSVSHSFGNTKQANKTMGGWYIMRSGRNMQTINLTGYMLDTKYCQERHDFVEKYYKTYIEDKKNANNEYVNDWSVNLIIEGKKYIGFVDSMNIQKSSIQPFLYQYSITYVSLNDILIYQSSQAIENRIKMSTPSYTGYDTSGAEISTTICGGVSALLGVL